VSNCSFLLDGIVPIRCGISPCEFGREGEEIKNTICCSSAELLI